MSARPVDGPGDHRAPTALQGMSEARRPTGPVVAIVVSTLVMLLGQLPLGPVLVRMSTSSFSGQLLLTASFAIPMLLFFAWVRGKEKRPVASLGFRGPAGGQLALGAGIGVLMTGITVLVNLLLGTATLGPLAWGMLPLALVLLLGFAIQGTTEEIAERGFVLQAVAPRWGLTAAVVVQTVLFAALHGANGGLTPVAWANLGGVAVFLALWVWVSGSLWGTSAFHAVWNWSQGNLWGAPVSHIAVGTSIAHYTPAAGAPSVLTGGSFGLEGSLVPFGLFVLGSVALAVAGRRRQARARTGAAPAA